MQPGRQREVRGEPHTVRRSVTHASRLRGQRDLWRSKRHHTHVGRTPVVRSAPGSLPRSLDGRSPACRVWPVIPRGTMRSRDTGVGLYGSRCEREQDAPYAVRRIARSRGRAVCLPSARTLPGQRRLSHRGRLHRGSRRVTRRGIRHAAGQRQHANVLGGYGRNPA